MTDRIPEDAWEQTTWEGNRRAQLRDAMSLTLRERLQAVEDMAEVAERFRQMRELADRLAQAPVSRKDERRNVNQPSAIEGPVLPRID